VVVDWDAFRYAWSLPKRPMNANNAASRAKEESLKKQYPPLNGVEISTPCIIVDMHGIILTWYLPGMLKDSRQVGIFTLSNHGSKPDAYQSEMMAATEILYPILEKEGPKDSDSGPWRENAKHYKPGTNAPAGSINISPAWFQQAHEVSVSGCRLIGSSFQMRRLCKNARRPAELSSRQLP
jgi:hypothetical protein